MMNIDEIETLVAIAQLGSLTQASRRLHRTQPAISRRLGILEHELGAPMFERVRGNRDLSSQRGSEPRCDVSAGASDRWTKRSRAMM